MQDLFEDLNARGLIKQTSDPELPSVLKNGNLTLYCGFDPTSDSLHIGHLLPLLTLRRFQQAGHRPIAVVGGATGMIGDPTFKSQERSLLSRDEIAHNAKGIREILMRYLDFSGKSAAVVTNNADWFADVGYIDFLRDVGKHFTINHMIAKESVRARLEDREQGISYTEFSYMLLQAYDFFILNQKEDCRLQVGGSDQWGNITAGIELIRRMSAAQGKATPSVYGLTFPLIMKSDGTKFGKTEGGAVWLDSKRTSPFQFYQYFVQTADSDVITFLNYFTFLRHDEIHSLAQSVTKEPEKRSAQQALAREMTRMVHGQDELEKVENAAKTLFSEEIRELDAKSLQDAFRDAPSTQKPRSALETGLPLVDIVAETGLCASKGMARKEITSGGIYVNNSRNSDINSILTTQDLISGTFILLRRGKKTYHLVKFT